VAGNNFTLPGATIDATDIYLNVGVGGVGLGTPVQRNIFDNPLAQAADPFSLLAAGFGNLNPSITPGGSANPVATAAGLDQPSPTEGGSTNPGKSAPQAASVSGSIANYFVRGVLVILGFIFVAVGLAMFGRTNAVASVVKGVVK